jgi:metal-responsive CopG/Arc/MetJ family transcriptional regulator
MPKSKIAITVDTALLEEVDRLVAQRRFTNRGHAFERALADKLERMNRSRLARECARLDVGEEKQLAEEGLVPTVEARRSERARRTQRDRAGRAMRRWKGATRAALS